MNNRTGQRFGNYSLVRLIERNTISEVYLGEHVEQKTQAAIKILQMKLTISEQESFLTQTHSLRKLKHPHLVSIWEAGIQENTAFLAMTYASNGSLRTSHPLGTRLPLEQILSYIRQITAALQYLHDQQLIYRNLRPQNILLGASDNILLADLALSPVSQNSHSLNMQEMMGNISYMAPEQLQGRSCSASDQYSLGTIVYEWLSGKVPFDGSFTEVASHHAFTPPTPLHTNVPEIAPAVEEVIQIALSKDPQWRFANIQAFYRAFEQACQHNQPPLEARTFRVPEKSILPNKREDQQTSPPFKQLATQSSHGSTPVPQPLPQPSRPHRSMAKIMLFCALALLAITSGSGLLYLAPWQHSSQAASPKKADTPQAVLLTATAQAHLHATAIAQADTSAEATAEAEASTEDAAATIAMQNLYTEATHGNPTINDPLSANGSNKWDENTSSKYERCAFIGGGYHVIEPHPTSNEDLSFYPCFANTTNFRNFALQARVTVLKGDWGGLVFLANNMHTNYCYFGVDSTGIYQFYCSLNGYRSWGLSSQKTSVGNKSPLANLLTVIVRNQHIFLYVNKQYVGSIKENDLSMGEIGVFAEDDASTTEAAFNEMQVWKL